MHRKREEIHCMNFPDGYQYIKPSLKDLQLCLSSSISLHHIIIVWYSIPSLCIGIIGLEYNVSNLFLPHLVQHCFWHSWWCSTDHHKGPICWDCVICNHNDKCLLIIYESKGILWNHFQQNETIMVIGRSFSMLNRNKLVIPWITKFSKQTTTFSRNASKQQMNKWSMSQQNFKQTSKRKIYKATH